MSAQIPEVKPKGLVQNYDCKSGKNCWVKKHMVDYTGYNDLLPGRNRFTDIDGVLELDSGRVLFIEFKTGNAKLTGVQQILHRNLTSKERQSTLVVWRNNDGRPTQCQFIVGGEECPVINLPSGEPSLKKVFEGWINTPQPRGHHAENAIRIALLEQKFNRTVDKQELDESFKQFTNRQDLREISKHNRNKQEIEDFFRQLLNKQEFNESFNQLTNKRELRRTFTVSRLLLLAIFFQGIIIINSLYPAYSQLLFDYLDTVFPLP